MIRSILYAILTGVVIYGLSMIVIRLHITQMAYAFDEMKAYERSLKEEQLRLRASLARSLSPENLHAKDYQEPNPGQVVKIP